ncbi:MAG: NADH:ubiquinone reductase (Na(+)-transporting) subunit F, partial [Bacteroidetes bacterium]|nr:NADH:ubiquinone reductase (Na(+)-transporting) subunit F [Bacteroidota bacterium]
MTIVMIASVAAFLTVILFLVVLLMYAKAKLMPSGDVSILVNGDESKLITTSPGGNLLFTLADQEIYLGSACGGGGTCALCKCQVMEGGGDVLPTELNYLTRKEAQDHWRLACQVKIRQDMKIAVPEEVFGVEKWECEVVSNENVATFIKELIVKLPSGKNLSFESGGYIQIYIPEYELDFSKDIDIPDEYKPDWDNSNMWDLKVTNDEEIFRAYSMANHPAEGDVIKLDIRIASPPWDATKKKFKNIPPGLATSYLFAM